MMAQWARTPDFTVLVVEFTMVKVSGTWHKRHLIAIVLLLLFFCFKQGRRLPGNERRRTQPYIRRAKLVIILT